MLVLASIIGFHTIKMNQINFYIEILLLRKLCFCFMAYTLYISLLLPLTKKDNKHESKNFSSCFKFLRKFDLRQKSYK